MKKIIISITLLVSVLARAESFKAADFVDQFDNKISVTQSTQWILFTAEKDVSTIVNKVIEDLNLTDPQSTNGLIVSDISKMPSLITRMFAIPKMKKYIYKLALDKEGLLTSAWPRQKGKATMLVLKDLEIVTTTFSDSAEEIKKFIKEQKPVITLSK